MSCVGEITAEEMDNTLIFFVFFVKGFHIGPNRNGSIRSQMHFYRTWTSLTLDVKTLLIFIEIQLAFVLKVYPFV